MHNILSLRQQTAIQNQWLRTRLDTLLPPLMQRSGIDCWLVIAREYNEDPVVMTLLPKPEMNARRLTILAFFRQDDNTVKRFTLSRYGNDIYESAWDADNEEQWQALRRLIDEQQPQTIGINTSDGFAFGDGLSQSLYTNLTEALGEEWMQKTVSAENLCIGWLETRIPAELDAYPNIVRIGHDIIAQAFSSEVIHPGITTTDDVVWWMRQTMRDMGFDAWFQPTIAIQAPGQRYDQNKNMRHLIQSGDLLHCDMGFHYLGLATDQQQHAYILKPNESAAPQGLRDALAHGNRLQDIHMQQMQIGRIGNEILASTLKQASNEGIRPMVYSHPLGFHGHAAGPTIGLWDSQGGVPVRGEYPVYDNTCYSIELNIKYDVPEWGGQEIRIALEEDAMMCEGEMFWLDGRQDKFYLIG